MLYVIHAPAAANGRAVVVGRVRLLELRSGLLLTIA